ncbi:MAG: tripartite tricarboxylate transporter TctB family protein [Aquisalimonadaceae bacterium]
MFATVPGRSGNWRRDLLAGVVIVLLGLLTIIEAQSYPTGTLARMGPGYFPVLMGSALVFLGLLIPLVGDPSGGDDEQADDMQVNAVDRTRGFLCIVGGLFAFLLLARFGGMVPAAFTLVFISALGDKSHTVNSAALLALVLTSAAVIVFAWGLQLQFPLFQWG